MRATASLVNRSVVVAALSLSLFACSAHEEAPSDSESDLTSTSYVSTRDYWKTSSDIDGWYGVLHTLRDDFDNICGDTFCGGDYSDLTSLGFECSVTRARGAVRECVWTFSGSSHLVNGSTGTVSSSVATFQCRVSPKTSARQLLTTLNAKGSERALFRVLPGSNQSLYDVLSECFQHPIGGSPVSGGQGTTYVDAFDSYDAGTDVDALYTAERALRSGFDQVCGDSFCEGEFTNLQALRMGCSVRATTGTLRSCKWFFAGSNNEIDPKTGAITVNAKTYKCTLPVRGTANDLAKALTESRTEGRDAIDRPLPGSTKSAYDVLVDCL